MNKLVSSSGVLAASVFLTLAATTTATAQADPLPGLTVTTVIDGLAKPWDAVVAPDGTVLTGERSGRFVIRAVDGTIRELAADLDDLYASGETGLMGIALATDFAASRTIYTCQGVQSSAGGTGSAGTGSAGGGSDNHIAVLSWTVDPEWTALTRTGTLVDDIPVADGGRHGGCRILAHPDGTLYVGTGDTASPTVPQDRNSLGGKVLHINADGSPAAGSPDRIFTLGHRNVQGLAIRPGTDQIYEVEQGTSRDDELNLLVPGGNYGYRPDRLPFIYDESVPMTDPTRVPGALAAVWSSGSPAIATPGLTFADGASWGSWNGAAVISSQQEEKLVFLKLSEDGTEFVDEADALVGTYGRLRSLTSFGGAGAFLLTTDNGSDDKVLLVTPAAD
ncbi:MULTISPECIES: sorbosone dehydrogenase family protein [unclassified Rhodococcus (in: high G+C Gram-positive bacteria)]|uniref:PQQ-dependent sugar dehydrogenase n=2 Tax=Rhodococcus TaxID=1827 RepID=UPI000B9AA982|nr:MULTISPECIES: PQQ-dependent sugar dehydrogenase [unclassified Rhodococcus (in: high G+C Gram-positive bacteria)]OZE23909.1 glucose dehydrogenase [Rhodococcus sp. 05-2254-6]OZE33069.1 glucose dehydrogenase [Rhodococcus sp. 05-2254-4]OZE44035.1 glucose dehydrogenase [Rhodococcus sp. 05-2254-3]OZE56282.1 glucose dehydrogenase [Rhodococcus sp. 05-2254-2]OZF47180.1 glucose dehydrogenase [Rhodococcus sp. 14-1411-2a]